jgi:hypothetical protein
MKLQRRVAYYSTSHLDHRRQQVGREHIVPRSHRNRQHFSHQIVRRLVSGALGPLRLCGSAIAGTAAMASTAIADTAVHISRMPAASASATDGLPPSPSAGHLPRRALLRMAVCAIGSCCCANCCMLRQQCSRSISTGSVSGGGGGGGRAGASAAAAAASRADADARDRAAGDCRFGVARLLLPGTAATTGRPEALPRATSAGPNAAAAACAFETTTILQPFCTFGPGLCTYAAAHVRTYSKIAHTPPAGHARSTDTALRHISHVKPTPALHQQSAVHSQVAAWQIVTVQARLAAAEAAADAAPSYGAQQATDPVAEAFSADIAACVRGHLSRQAGGRQQAGRQQRKCFCPDADVGQPSCDVHRCCQAL